MRKSAHGVDKFDVDGFGADLAYTVDGGDWNGISYENFNAVQAFVDFYGYSIHPGLRKKQDDKQPVYGI